MAVGIHRTSLVLLLVTFLLAGCGTSSGSGDGDDAGETIDRGGGDTTIADLPVDPGIDDGIAEVSVETGDDPVHDPFFPDNDDEIDLDIDHGMDLETDDGGPGPEPMATNIAVTFGGGTTGSASYQLNVAIGGPVTGQEISSTNYNMNVGVGALVLQ